MTELMTPRLRLRQWRAADLEPFAALNGDPAVMALMPACLTRAESDSLVHAAEAAIARRGWGLWATELRAGGELIGSVGLGVPSFSRCKRRLRASAIACRARAASPSALPAEAASVAGRRAGS